MNQVPCRNAYIKYFGAWTVNRQQVLADQVQCATPCLPTCSALQCNTAARTVGTQSRRCASASTAGWRSWPKHRRKAKGICIILSSKPEVCQQPHPAAPACGPTAARGACSNVALAVQKHYKPVTLAAAIWLATGGIAPAAQLSRALPHT